MAAAIDKSQAAPAIEIVNVPAYNANPGVFTGRVTNANPADYKVAALVFVSGLGFFSKPYCDATTTALGPDGSFSVLLTTGGIDRLATLIGLLVVPSSASVPCYSAEPGIPLALEQQAVAEALIPRPNPAQRTIEFSGERWLVKSSPQPVGPGPNFFSESPDNVWVDNIGRLHLKITYRNGQWNCAEIYSERTVGYGKYNFQIETLPELDRNVVFGAFTWADGERVSREIDTLELGRFGNAGDANNAQNVVQPHTTPGNQLRFILPSIAPTVHSMDWQANSVSFRSSDTQSAVLHQWNYLAQPPVPDSARLNYRLNLWLVASPSDGKEVEVIVSSFSYTPNSALFVPVAPCRLVDTRNSSGPLGGPAIAGGTARDFFPPSAGCGVPSNATAYSLNVTAVPRGPLAYLTVWPQGGARPLVSTLNSFDGRVKANAAIVPAGGQGGVSVYVTDLSDVVIDVNGYFVSQAAAGSLAFYPVAPCRIMDSRGAQGSLGGPSLSAGVPRAIPVRGACGIPPEASAYALNYTAIPHGPLWYLTTWPTGTPMPLVSTLNSFSGSITANAAIVPAGEGGAVNVFATNSTDLAVDVAGYFAPPLSPGALSFYPVSPCRLLDTRGVDGPLGGPALAGSRVFPLSLGSCGVSRDAAAYSLNATVVPYSVLSYLTLWPMGLLQPLVSTLNAIDGSISSNAAIVPVGSGGVDAFATDKTDLILDVNGYFAP